MNEWEEKEYTKNLDWQSWKKLIAYIKPYKKLMIVLAMIMVLNAGVDAAFPLFTKYAVDHFVVGQTTQGIGLFSLAFFLMIFFQAVNIYFLIYIAGKVEMGVSYDIRKRGFQKLQELSYSYYDQTPIGWIMSRMTSDSSRLSETLSWGLVDMSWGFSMMTGIIAIMFWMNWKLALVSLSVTPVLVIASIWFQKRILKNYRQVRKINSKLTGMINEGIVGAKTTKTLVREDLNFEEFKNTTGQMYSASVRSALVSALYMPVVLTLGAIGTGLVLWKGGDLLMLKIVSIGTLLAFIQYTVQFFDPIYELARIFSELQGAQAAAERLLTLLETEIEITDREDVEKLYGTVYQPKKEQYPELKGNIEFRDVCFSYKNGEKVFENFNLRIKAGQTVALVGETGSGKTTLVNLICRFYEPQAGEILIDGVEYRDRALHWLHSNLGYVLQSPHLFSGTIEDNIRYGNLNATQEDIERAAEIVQADSFIRDLPEGYKTKIGEGGNGLSTGQKQLLSFARAIIANPSIFVLDEATSSIDTEMEKLIQNAIRLVLKSRTSLIVAHRLSTIIDADQIVVLKNGEIVEMGRHRELIMKKGYYYQLYTRQFLQEKEKEIEQCS